MTEASKMILVVTTAVKLKQLWHKLYIVWWSSTFVKHSMSSESSDQFVIKCLWLNRCSLVSSTSTSDYLKTLQAVSAVSAIRRRTTKAPPICKLLLLAAGQRFLSCEVGGLKRRHKGETWAKYVAMNRNTDNISEKFSALQRQMDRFGDQNGQ